VSVLLLLRFVKWMAVLALVTGSVGSVLPSNLTDRRRFAFWLAGPGFGLTWLSGFALVAYTGVSALSWWILGGAALSIVSINAVLYAVGREGRRNSITALLAIAPLVVIVALMVWRP
jgi:hypothetical protein